MSEALAGGGLGTLSVASTIASLRAGSIGIPEIIKDLVRDILATIRAELANPTGRVLSEQALKFERAFSTAAAAQEFVERGAERILSGADELHEELGGFLDVIIPQSLSLEGLLERLSPLLLNPSRVPGEPCLAPAPLLRDLLDIALGRITGGLDAIIGKVRSTVQDLLLPAAAKGDDLAHFVQSILDDPVTAALNLVLGVQNQIDCEVTARKDVGESVIEAGFKRLVGFVEGVLA